MSDFVNDNNIICSKLIIKTNILYDILKRNADIKISKHKSKIEKLKNECAKKFKNDKIETIYNKVIEFYYKNNKEYNLSECVYIFSELFKDKKENDVYKYLDNMLEKLYLLIFDEKFDKLLKDKYS